MQKFQKLKRLSQIAIVKQYEEPIVSNNDDAPKIQKAIPAKLKDMARKSGELLDSVIKQFNKESSDITKNKIMDAIIEHSKLEESIIEQLP
jgi:hypothetical protein